MPKKKLTYETAYAELQQILNAMQTDHIGLDDLAEKLRHAKELVKFCQEKLHNVEKELDEVFDEEGK